MTISKDLTMNRYPYITTHEISKLIGKVLTESFPTSNFDRKAYIYSMGESINISWVDGPTKNQIQKIIDRFTGEHDSVEECGVRLFDGKFVCFYGPTFYLTRRNTIIPSDSTTEVFAEKSKTLSRIQFLSN